MAAGKSGPRLGILGGTFDPIHYGHLRLAEEVGETLNLEHIYLIPAALPPHKGQRSVSAFEHRLEMTRVASAESPRLKVLDIEARRQGFSYSIETYSSNHTEAIVTDNYDRAQRFLQEVNSSVVLVNASTRFNDGNQLGLGAEIGINTSKLHAFGPMGLAELTTQKFIVYGSGQIRT